MLKRWLAKLAKWIVLLYFKTLRVQTVGEGAAVAVCKHSGAGIVFLCWHDSLALLPAIMWIGRHRKLTILISNSRDGNLVAALVCQFHNVQVIRVKHTARAMALRQACRCLERGEALLITPDGPRGPRRHVKAGALYACHKTGGLLVPVGFSSSRHTTLGSWDRFCLPWPLSRVRFSYHEPILVRPDADLEAVKRQVEQAFAAIERGPPAAATS